MHSHSQCCAPLILFKSLICIFNLILTLIYSSYFILPLLYTPALLCTSNLVLSLITLFNTTTHSALSLSAPLMALLCTSDLFWSLIFILNLVSTLSCSFYFVLSLHCALTGPVVYLLLSFVAFLHPQCHWCAPLS